MSMPTHRHTAKTISFLSALFLSAACGSALGEPNNYTINNITPVDAGGTTVLIGTHCADDVTSIKIEVTADNAVSIADAYVRAYFYDADKQLIESHYRPPTAPCVWVGHEQHVPIPIMYEAGKARIFYFATEGPRPLPWKNIVVVFGDDDKAVAQVYPSGEPADFDFPEQVLLIKH